jgi:hypothetical protein
MLCGKFGWFQSRITENVGAALVAAHGKHKKSSLLVGGHKGGPYIF